MELDIKKYINKYFDTGKPKLDIKKHIDTEVPTIENSVKQALFSNSSCEYLDYFMERRYLDSVLSEMEPYPILEDKSIGWLRINRLPVNPMNKEGYELLPRWQTVLASLHSWYSPVVFLIQRVSGQTNIYMGMMADDVGSALQRLKNVVTNCMAGISIEELDQNTQLQVAKELLKQPEGGALTGIPSFRKNTNFGLLQTLDQIAFGIQDQYGNDIDFSFVVVADPIPDTGITHSLSQLQQLSSTVHTLVRTSFSENAGKSYSHTEGTSTSKSTATSKQVPSINIKGVEVSPQKTVTKTTTTSESASDTVQSSSSFTTNKDVVNKFAEYTEHLTEMHAERLRAGRNLGFWNVGIYVLSGVQDNVTTLLGMLRSLYSGDKTYIEPIRIHLFGRNSTAVGIAQGCNLMSFGENLQDKKEWHMLGRIYQDLSTPMNTEELSLVTSLPQNDVPGLRFVRTSVRFANNPGSSSGENPLVIGRIKDYGIVQSNEYKIDVNSLVRHSLVAGSTGCGKTTTCKTIINSVIDRNIPFLIIEPAKDEYVRWALQQKKQGKQINIFMPGIEKFEGVLLDRLKINPFQPAAIDNAPIDMMTRCEQMTAIFNASLPNSDVLPVIIDETFFTYLTSQDFGKDFLRGEMQQRSEYPKLDGVLEIAKRILKNRGYSQEVSNGLAAALETRFTYLTRGKRGDILNVRNSTSWDKLFNQPTVINLSKIANSKDKALIMSLLLLSLYEYRISAYTYDEKYRTEAQANKLMHLTLIEEAHNVLAKPGQDSLGTGNPQQVVADLFSNILSEVRSFGEGFMIVDQVPTRLIPDVIKNTNYKIVHRLASPDDCQVMAAALALRPDQESILPMLEQGNVVIAGDKDDAAVWVQVNKPKVNL